MRQILIPIILASLVVASPLTAASEPVYPDSSPEPSTYDDPCAEARQRLDAALAEIHERYRHEYAALDKERETFYSQPRTMEEQERFEAYQQEQREALQQAEGREQHDAHAAFEAECAQTYDHNATTGPAEPVPYTHSDPWMDEECQAAIRAAETAQRGEHERFAAEMQARWEAFEAEMRGHWDAFHSEGNHTPEEYQRFEDEMETKRAAFRHEMRGYEESERLAADALMQAYQDKIHAACRPTMITPAMPDTAMPGELATLHRECEAEVHRLEVAQRAEISAMAASWNDTDSQEAEVQHERIDARHAQYEDRLRVVMRECEERARVYWQEHMGAHLQDQPPAERMGSWSVEMSGGSILLTGKYVSLVGDPTTNTMDRIAVAGETFIAHLDTMGHLRFFDMEETRDGDSVLNAKGDDILLRIHDDPSGVINLRATREHAFLLTLPPSIEVSPHMNGWILEGAGSTAFVRSAAGQSTWSSEDRILKVWGEATFFVEGAAGNEIVPVAGNKHRPQLVEAMKERRLGAEVSIAKTQDGDAKDDAIVYDGEVAVAVETPRRGEVAPVVVTVSSDTLTEGRTFVVNLENGVLGRHLSIAYYDVDEQSGDETQVEIRKASSLADVLDATDDETAEYWIVQDEDGLQVLVSITHWSVHRFRMEAASPPEDGLKSLPGPALGLVLVAVLAFVARRRML